MKLELVKEESLTKSPWYTVTIDGEYKFGSWDYQDALNVFNTLLKDAKALDVRKEILKSEEVGVSLESNQTS